MIMNNGGHEKEVTIGDVVGCVVHGCFYFVTSEGISIILPSISLEIASGCIPVEAIALWITFSLEMLAGVSLVEEGILRLVFAVVGNTSQGLLVDETIIGLHSTRSSLGAIACPFFSDINESSDNTVAIERGSFDMEGNIRLHKSAGKGVASETEEGIIFQQGDHGEMPNNIGRHTSATAVFSKVKVVLLLYYYMVAWLLLYVSCVFDMIAGQCGNKNLYNEKIAGEAKDK
ncbi:unnamed protein product [Lactuca saligna]|uniref:Uncharacterized protein n=1 Tax=Lactuca saligna TaxID=75948 RepID=A0AA35ZT08_LACSI|nr:unnamed protein product [Lactuca saligna]